MVRGYSSSHCRCIFSPRSECTVADYRQTVKATVVLNGTVDYYMCSETTAGVHPDTIGCAAREFQLRAGAGAAMGHFASDASIANVVPNGRRRLNQNDLMPGSTVSITLELSTSTDVSEQLATTLRAASRILSMTSKCRQCMHLSRVR